ncbi:MAG: hypothetical protein ACRD44_16295, partial [Bryobacteraceae bacterium]
VLAPVHADAGALRRLQHAPVAFQTPGFEILELRRKRLLEWRVTLRPFAVAQGRLAQGRLRDGRRVVH